MPGNWQPKGLIPNITRKWHCSCQHGSVLVNISCNIKAFASNLAICCFLSILFKNKLIASQKQVNVRTPEVKVFEILRAYSTLFFFFTLSPLISAHCLMMIIEKDWSLDLHVEVALLNSQPSLNEELETCPSCKLALLAGFFCTQIGKRYSRVWPRQRKRHNWRTIKVVLISCQHLVVYCHYIFHCCVCFASVHFHLVLQGW